MSISAKSIRALYDRQVGWRKTFFLYLVCVYVPICAMMSFEMKIAPVDSLLLQDKLKSFLDEQHISVAVSVYTNADLNLPSRQTGSTIQKLINDNDESKVIVLDVIGGKWVYWLIIDDGITNETRDYVISTAEEQIKKTYRFKYFKELFIYLLASTLLAIIAYIFGVFVEVFGKKKRKL